MKIKETIGFIGCGNMGQAILEGVLAKRAAKPVQIFIFDADRKKCEALRRRFSVRVCASNGEVICKSRIVILAIKPQELQKIALELVECHPDALDCHAERSEASANSDPSLSLRMTKKQHDNKQKKIMISILAGTPLEKVRRLLGTRHSYMRAMPNLGAKVGESITALAGDSRALFAAEVIFGCCGETIRVAEKHMDFVTAVSGNGPAYFFLLMEMLSGYARKKGLPQDDAQKLAVQTCIGAGKLANASRTSPEVLRKQVTSKGGTTEAALSVLFKKGIQKIFNEALTKAVKRARELSRK